MTQKAKYEEATLYLSKQLLTAHKVYPQIWFEAAAVTAIPPRPPRSPLRINIPDVPLTHEIESKEYTRKPCEIHGKVASK